MGLSYDWKTGGKPSMHRLMICSAFVLAASGSALAGSLSISSPRTGATSWDGRVSGQGCLPGHTVQVIIETDRHYPQGKVNCGSSSSWTVTDTHPTQGVVNKVYAVMRESSGRVVGRTGEVTVNLGVSLGELRVSVDIDDLTAAWNPVSAVDYFLRGVYAKIRVEVDLGQSAPSVVDAVWAEFSADGGAMNSIVPNMNHSRHQLRHQGSGVYALEISFQCALDVVTTLISAGALRSGTGGIVSFLNSSPPISLDAIVIEGSGQEVRKRVGRSVPTYFSDFAPTQLQTIEGSI
jgi:hypothetical protein